MLSAKMGLKNPRLTPKERNLLKGAVRRVFSRSELRKLALSTVAIDHHDPARPRVKKWGRCPGCKEPTPAYKMQVDHVSPLVPVDTTLEDMSMDTLIDRAWCELKGLQPLCLPCHTSKTKEENRIRRQIKKGLKK